MTIKIISTSNIVNNPPPITNAPLRETFEEIRSDYGRSETERFEKVMATEERHDNFMTCLLIGSLAAVFLLVRGIYKSAKIKISNSLNYISAKIKNAKTFIA